MTRLLIAPYVRLGIFAPTPRRLHCRASLGHTPDMVPKIVQTVPRVTSAQTHQWALCRAYWVSIVSVETSCVPRVLQVPRALAGTSVRSYAGRETILFLAQLSALCVRLADIVLMGGTVLRARMVRIQSLESLLATLATQVRTALHRVSLSGAPRDTTARAQRRIVLFAQVLHYCFAFIVVCYNSIVCSWI